MFAEQQDKEDNHRHGIDFAFLGGMLALDFVNTEVIVRGKPYDLLSSPDETARWWYEALVHYPNGEHVIGETTSALWSLPLLEKIKHTREAIRTLCTNVIEHQPFDIEAIATLNAILALGYSALDIVSEQQVIPVYRTRDANQKSILLPIALSAFHLLTQMEKQRLHQCKNERCILFFYDTTKSATRQWCSLECMNRARSLQHYRQSKQENKKV